MDLLSLILLIVLVMWLAGAVGSAPPAGNIVWVLVVVALVLFFAVGWSGYHSGVFWHR